MPNLDRDLAGLEEDGAEDAYYAQLPSASGTKPKKSSADADADDDDEELPSVEELIHQQESGHTTEEKPKKTAIPAEIEDDRDVVVDDLAFMEEAALEIEAERDELLSEQDEEM